MRVCRLFLALFCSLATSVTLPLLAIPVPAAENEHNAVRILEQLQRQAFQYFLDHRHPASGLVRDRAGNLPGAPEDGRMASIAAVGYFLSVLPIAADRGWLDAEQAEEEAQRILTTAEALPQRDGLFYHFMDWESGRPWHNSEVSVLDSAIFFNGVMTAAVGFPACADQATRLLERAAWHEYVIEREGRRYLSFGWRDRQGLIGAINARTSELAMPLWLGCGQNRIPVECWYNTSTDSQGIAGYRVMHGRLPLFVHYYGLGWAALEGCVDREGVNLYENAVRAAHGNRRFCLESAARRWPTFRREHGGWWGISAGDAARGYVAPGPVLEQVDGTVWPTAALGAWPWIPRQLEGDLVQWRDSHVWHRVHGRYGLAPFNLASGWVGRQIIGIDLGAFLVSTSQRDEVSVQSLWMGHPLAQSALLEIGFRPLR